MGLLGDLKDPFNDINLSKEELDNKLNHKMFDNADLENLTFWQSLANKFTGNYDYQRNKALQLNAQVFNAEEAQKQRAYEERLANTAYQRSMADLGKAGYNPAMALGSGGAFVPSGATASSSPAHYSDNTRGFEFLANALLAAVSLGVKASLNASQIALNEVKGATLGAGSASQIALNTIKGSELLSKSGLNRSRGNFYDVMVGDRALGKHAISNNDKRNPSKKEVPLPSWWNTYQENMKKKYGK